MATMNISLPDQMKSWVEECVQSGRYANASDYVRDLIRNDHLKLEQLRQALIEGENSGPSTGLDINAFIADKKKSLSLCARLFYLRRPNQTSVVSETTHLRNGVSSRLKSMFVNCGQHCNHNLAIILPPPISAM